MIQDKDKENQLALNNKTSQTSSKSVQTNFNTEKNTLQQIIIELKNSMETLQKETQIQIEKKAKEILY